MAATAADDGGSGDAAPAVAEGEAEVEGEGAIGQLQTVVEEKAGPAVEPDWSKVLEADGPGSKFTSHLPLPVSSRSSLTACL